ncbi:conserved hypothetical protein [Neorickettsia risticii str. Illinois]|uniref:Uncharacterized protein n=1 Tax=Neorickettsia risticii (strain Illinois) TaxID=434131 RepID=C6V5R1_NEORI|nr:hypothetical protein [Neorickettsia risticii]ACT69733.1 conserved hypothetical protein [Neorickettsia risticii str. Illinois]
MLPTYEFKNQFAFSLGDSTNKIAEEVLGRCFGRVDPLHIRVKTQNVGVISVDILAPDRSTLIKTQIILEVGAKTVLRDIEGQFFGLLHNTTTLIAPSDALSAWILSRIASQEDEHTPGIKNRYEIATKNLKGLKKKSQIFGILGIVFCVYLIIAATLSTAAALTDNSSLNRYGLPTFVALTAVFAALAIAFAVATFCMKKEIKKADIVFSCVHNELLALHDVSIEELAQLCNQYLQEQGMAIELVKPITEHENPPEVTSALPQQNEAEFCRFS